MSETFLKKPDFGRRKHLSMRMCSSMTQKQTTPAEKSLTGSWSQECQLRHPKTMLMCFFEVEGVTYHQLLSLENSVPLLRKQLALLEYPLSQSNSAADVPFYVPEIKNVLERVWFWVTCRRHTGNCDDILKESSEDNFWQFFQEWKKWFVRIRVF